MSEHNVLVKAISFLFIIIDTLSTSRLSGNYKETSVSNGNVYRKTMSIFMTIKGFYLFYIFSLYI